MEVVLGVGNNLIKDIDTTLARLGLLSGTIRLMRVDTSPSGTWPTNFGIAKTGSVILQMSYSSNVEYQVLFRNNLEGKMFYRVRQTDWGEWKEISFVN